MKVSFQVLWFLVVAIGSGAGANGQSPTPAGDWSGWQAAAEARFHVPTDDELRSRRVALLGQIAQLRTTLATMPDGELLAHQMQLDMLEEQLRGERPDPSKLDLVALRMSRSFPRDVQHPIDAVRMAVRRQADELRLQANPQAATEFKINVDALAAELKTAGAAGLPAESAKAREAYAWLSRTHLIDDLLVQTLPVVSHPNQIVRIERAFLAPLADRPIKQPVNINENVKGVQITGHGEVNAKATLLMRPNTTRGELSVQVDGRVQVPVTARKKPATIQAVNRAQFTADQTIFVTQAGVELAATQVQVRSHTSLGGVCLDFHCRLLRAAVTPIARKVASKQMAKGDAETAAKVKKQIQDAVKEQATDAVASANELIQRIFWQTVDARDVSPHVHVSTTNEELVWRGDYRSPWELGAPSQPPAWAGSRPQISIQLHETAFNNTTAVAANRRMNEVAFKELVFDTLRLKPESPEPNAGGRVPAAFTFADEDPLVVGANKGEFYGTLRIKSFELDEKLYEGPVRTVRVRYRPTLDETGVTVTRQGDLQIEPANAPNMAECHRCMERFLVPKAHADRIHAPVGVAPPTAGHAKLTHFVLDHGWLMVGFTRVDANTTSTTGGNAQ